MNVKAGLVVGLAIPRTIRLLWSVVRASFFRFPTFGFASGNEEGQVISKALHLDLEYLYLFYLSFQSLRFIFDKPLFISQGNNNRTPSLMNWTLNAKRQCLPSSVLPLDLKAGSENLASILHKRLSRDY